MRHFGNGLGLALVGIAATAFFLWQLSQQHTPSEPQPATAESQPAPTTEPIREPARSQANGASSASEPLTLEGVVVDGTGVPVPGAQLHYALPGATERCSAAVEAPPEQMAGPLLSDDHGRFALRLGGSGVDDGAPPCIRIQAAKAGYVETTVAVPLPAVADNVVPDVVRLELLAARTLRGSVRDQHGTPIANARVQAWIAAAETAAGNADDDDCGPASDASRATTDAEGQFQLAAAHRPVCIQASHPDFSSSAVALIARADDTIEDLELVLTPTLVAEGTVRDHLGHALPGFAFTLVKTPGSGQPFRRTARSDAGGHFVVTNMHAGRYAVQSLDPAYAVAAPNELVIEPDRSPAALEVQVLPLIDIRGRVLDAGGRPVAGASVRTRGLQQAELFVSGPEHTGPEGTFALRTEYARPAAEAMARLALDDDAPAASTANVVCLLLAHEQHGPLATAVALDPAADVIDVGDLYLPEPAVHVDGRVLDHRGEPVAADLTFRRSAEPTPETQPDCAGPSVQQRARAGASGRFSIGLDAAGLYEVRVETRRYQPRELELDIATSPAPLTIRLD